MEEARSGESDIGAAAREVARHQRSYVNFKQYERNMYSYKLTL